MKTILNRWLNKWRKILTDFLSGIGIFWLLVEIASYSTNTAVDSFLKSIPVFSVIFFIILIISFWINKPKTFFAYNLRGKDNFVEIRVCDALQMRGALVVPVNNEFDMDLGGNVMKVSSIQKQLIDLYYSGKVEHLKTDITNRGISIGTQHRIGMTTEIEQKGKKFFLLVNSTKQKNNRVRAEIDDFITALNELWIYIALETSRTDIVTIPLIGTQHSRDANLSMMTTIKEIITSYIEASKSLNICSKLVISIHPSDLKKGTVDLDELNEYLKFSCGHYRQVTLQQRTNDPDDGTKIIKIEN